VSRHLDGDSTFPCIATPALAAEATAADFLDGSRKALRLTEQDQLMNSLATRGISLGSSSKARRKGPLCERRHLIATVGTVGL
jgi:hypothetical protein